VFFLETILDQVRFMGSVLDISQLRSRVREITGKGATVAAEIVRKGLEAGYFCSPSPKGVLRVAFPEQMREALFPKLYFPGGSEEGREALM
jgi:hypothetical protein